MEILNLLLLPSLQIKPRKNSEWNHVLDRFLRVEMSWWKSKQNECLCKSSRPQGSLGFFVMKNLAEFAGSRSQKSSLGVLKSSSNSTKKSIIKKRLQHKCFPVKFTKFLGFFWGLPLRLSAINSKFSWKKVFAAAKILKQPP